MKVTIAGLAILGGLGLAFAAWGIHTPAGRSSFDEMDGIIPVFAGFAGALLVGIAAILVVVSLVRRRLRSR